MIKNIVYFYNGRYIFVSESNEIITILILYIMDLSVYQKAEFLKSRGYNVGIAKGTENYPHHVTKPGTQLNSSVNYAYNLEMKEDTFLTSDNLPLNDQFVELPYENEKIQFTGLVSEERNDGFNSFVIASTLITNKKGQTCEGFTRFNYCMDQSKFVKALDCNFYKL